MQAGLLAWGLLLGGLPLLSGAPGGDDAYYHAMYAQQHARCWLGGVPFPRWYPDLNGGLGSPEPRPRPLLPLMLHAAFALVLNDAVAAISVATLIIPACAALVMLAAARKWGASLIAAAASAGMWAASPYLMVTLHERAALQEAWACVLLPWVFVTLLPPAPRTGKDALTGGVAFALLLATQLLFAFMAGLAIAVAHLVSRRRRFLHVASAGALGFGLAAASWWPNVVSLGRIQGERFASGWFDWRERFLFTGGTADPVLARHMLFAFLAAAALAVLCVFAGTSTARTRALAGLTLAVLATPLAFPAYRFLPGLPLLQFPWRWLAPASCLVVLAFASLTRPRLRWVGVGLFLLPLVVPFAWRWRLPAGPPLRPIDSPAVAARAATRFGVPPLLPSFPATLPRGVNLEEALRAAAGAKVMLPAAEQEGPRTWTWKLRRDASGPVALPLLADDGWRGELDGRPLGWRAQRGLVDVTVPAGLHTLTLAQVLLPEDTFGLATTAVTALAFLLFARRKHPRAGYGSA